MNEAFNITEKFEKNEKYDLASLFANEDVMGWFSDPTHLVKRARRRGLAKWVSLSGRKTKYWITISDEYIISLELPKDVVYPEKSHSQSDEFPL